MLLKLKIGTNHNDFNISHYNIRILQTRWRPTSFVNKDCWPRDHLFLRQVKQFLSKASLHENNISLSSYMYRQSIKSATIGYFNVLILF